MRYADRLIIGFLDLVESLFNVISLVLAKPLGLVGYVEHLSRLPWTIIRLAPMGAGSLILRSRLAHSFGNYDKAGSILFGVIRTIEEEIKINAEKLNSFRSILTSLYTELVKLYLRNGRIDDATHTLIRGCRVLGIDYLPDLQRYDFKTAQIVKAGLAASKFLDEGAVATLTVDRPNHGSPFGLKPLSSDPSARREKTSKDGSGPKRGAKILLFPTVQQNP